MAESEDEAKRLQLVTNEQAKLRATYLNSMAVAVFAIGGFAPVVSYLSAGPAAHYGVIAGLAISCVVSSWMIHRLAQGS